MQQKPGDIYHEDVTPSLAKRSRRKTSERRKKTARQRSEMRQRQKETAMATPLRSSRSRKRRTSHNMPSSFTALLLWMVIGLILVAYLGFLGHSYLRRKSQIAIATGKINPAPTTVVTEVLTPPTITLAMIEGLSQQQKRVRQESDIALTMLDNNRHEKALSRLTALQQAFPRDLETKMALAKAQIAAKNYPAAITLLHEALIADPRNDESRIMLAQALLHQQQNEEALAIATWLLAANTYSQEANDIAANAYIAMNKPGWSIPHLRRIITQDRENFSALNRLAKVFSDIGEHQQAVLEFTRMIDMNLADSVTYCNLAICYAQQEKAEKAAIILDQAAQEYGYDFVFSWLERSGFDTIRETPSFKTFAARKQMSKKQKLPDKPPPE